MSERGQKDIQNLRQQELERGNTVDGGSLSRVGCTALVVLVTK